MSIASNKYFMHQLTPYDELENDSRVEYVHGSYCKLRRCSETLNQTIVRTMMYTGTLDRYIETDIGLNRYNDQNIVEYTNAMNELRNAVYSLLEKGTYISKDESMKTRFADVEVTKGAAGITAVSLDIPVTNFHTGEEGFIDVCDIPALHYNMIKCKEFTRVAEILLPAKKLESTALMLIIAAGTVADL